MKAIKVPSIEDYYLNESNKEIVGQIDQSKQLKIVIDKEVDSLKSKLGIVRNDFDNRKSELKKLEDELKKNKVKNFMSIKDLENSTNELRAKKREINELENKREVLHGDLENLKEVILKDRSKLESLKNQKTGFKNNVSLLDEQLKFLKEDILSSKTLREELDSEVNRLSILNNNLNKKIEGQKEFILKNSEKIENSKKIETACRRKIGSLLTEKDMIQNEVVKLKADQANIEFKLNNLNSNILDQKSKEKLYLTQEKEFLYKKIDLEQKIQERESQNEEYNRKKELLSYELENIKRNLLLKKNEFKKVTFKTIEATNEHENLENRKNEINKELVELERDHEKGVQAKKKLTNELESIKNKFDEVVEEKKGKVLELNNTIEELKSNYSFESTEFKKELEKLKVEEENKKKDVEKLNFELFGMIQSLEQNKNAIDDSADQLQRINNELSIKESQIEKDKKTIGSLENRETLLLRKLELLEEEIEDREENLYKEKELLMREVENWKNEKLNTFNKEMFEKEQAYLKKIQDKENRIIQEAHKKKEEAEKFLRESQKIYQDREFLSYELMAFAEKSANDVLKESNKKAGELIHNTSVDLLAKESEVQKKINERKEKTISQINRRKQIEMDKLKRFENKYIEKVKRKEKELLKKFGIKQINFLEEKKKEELLKIKALKEKELKEKNELEKQKEEILIEVSELKEKSFDEIERAKKQEYEKIGQTKMNELKKTELEIQKKLSELNKTIDSRIDTAIKGVTEIMSTQKDHGNNQDILKDLKHIIENSFKGDNSKADKESKVVLQFNPEKNKSLKSIILKQGMNILIPSALASIFIFDVGGVRSISTNFVKKMMVNEKSSSELFVKKQKEKLDKKYVFTPIQDNVVKSSYTDNVLYTKEFSKFFNNQEFQNEWILKLYEFITVQFELPEEIAISYISTETTLIKDLQIEMAKIKPDKKDIGIQKLTDLENKSLKWFYKKLSPDQVKNFNEFRLNYFKEQYDSIIIDTK